MANGYRICIIVPQGYVHAGCFLEVAVLLKYSLRDLGYDCDIAINELHPDYTNIILGYHLLKGVSALSSVAYIPFQLEQIDSNIGPLHLNSRAILAGAQNVWDFSQKNITALKAVGINASYLPLGYHPALERIPRSAQSEVDLLFYGSTTPRRQPLLKSLEQRAGLRYRSIFGLYGQKRDAAIGSARCIVNVHAYPFSQFESVRVSYLLNNGCFVVSEESADYPYATVPLVQASLEQLEETIAWWLDHEEQRQSRSRECYEQFRNDCPMTACLAPLVNC